MNPKAVVTVDAGEEPWGLGLQPAACEACGRSWLVGRGDVGRSCACGEGTLESAPARVPSEPPERIVPAAIAGEALTKSIERHLGRFWFRDKRRRASDLAGRAVLVWWPEWLVDASVEGPWTGEVGFDYEAQSTVEELSGGRWVSRNKVDVRVRWEPRAGVLTRRYDNVPVPALANPGVLPRLSGPGVDPPFDAAHLGAGRIWLPDLPPTEVWAQADPAFRAAAAGEIRLATDAQHVRDVHLTPAYRDDVWTVRLRPAWFTGYADDDGTFMPLIVDGVTGRSWGPVLASIRAAWVWTGVIGGIGALLLLGALVTAVAGLLFPPIWVVTAGLAVVGAIVLVASIGPVASVWMHNRGERGRG